jgi:hypothetical protein
LLGSNKARGWGGAWEKADDANWTLAGLTNRLPVITVVIWCFSCVCARFVFRRFVSWYDAFREADIPEIKRYLRTARTSDFFFGFDEHKFLLFRQKYRFYTAYLNYTYFCRYFKELCFKLFSQGKDALQVFKQYFKFVSKSAILRQKPYG